MRRIFIELVMLVCLCLLTACSSRPHDVKEVASLPDIYPDYIGVTVPVEIAPLNLFLSIHHLLEEKNRIIQTPTLSIKFRSN